MVRAIQPEPWPKWLIAAWVGANMLVLGGMGWGAAMFYERVPAWPGGAAPAVALGLVLSWQLGRIGNKFDQMPVSLPLGWAEALAPLGVEVVQFKGSRVEFQGTSAILPRATKPWSPELVAEVVAAHRSTRTMNVSLWAFGTGLAVYVLCEFLNWELKLGIPEFVLIAACTVGALFVASFVFQPKVKLPPSVEEALAKLPKEAKA